MDTPTVPARSLIAQDVDAPALFARVEERFSDRLEILELVAASSERALFVARDRVLKRRVGLRVHLRPGTPLRTWFERETELIAALDHPLFRSVYTAGYLSDWAYRVVQWIEGESLADAVARGPRPVPAVLQLARDLAGALEYLHAQRIVLRRLVPTSVLIDSTERTFLIDLRWVSVLLDVAAPHQDSLERSFLAPEVREGAAGDPASDVYGAGALLYFAATGRPPDSDPGAILRPRTIREACPAALERVVMRALSADPTARYFTAVEMLDDLLSDLGEFDIRLPLASARGAAQEDPHAWEKRLRRALGDDYELLEELGSGGFGRVYRVRDLALEREVALKVLHPYLTADPAVVERFRREARVAAQLIHPNIANTYDIGGRGGLLWYTMEYVRGKNLARLVETEGPLGPERLVGILGDTLDALDHAHRRGLVHRDLKPENLLIEESSGRVRIADFGLAIALQRSDGFGGASSQSGTPAFASPEQLLGETVDHRADLYSLSLVALFALTGQVPTAGGTVESVVARRSVGDLPELDDLRRDVPEGLLRVLQRGAERHAADRFGSAAEYALALETALSPERPGILGLFRRLTGSP